MSQSIKVGALSEFPPNITKSVHVEGKEICVVNHENQFWAFDEQCTHAAQTLSECDVEDFLVTCPLHGAKFDIKSGAAKSLPAVEPLQTYKTNIKGGDLHIELP